MKYTRIGLALLLAVSAVSWSQVPAVKLSESGICHHGRSPWFSRTKSFTPYPSLEACLAASGRLPKGSDSNVAFDGPATSKRYFGVQFYLEDLLKHPVDLVTDKALRPELRPFVEKEAIHVGIR